MKLKLFVLLIPALMIFCSAAHAQSVGSISSTAQPVQFNEHPEHAGPHAMRSEQPIVGGGSDTYSYAQGERPLWEFGPVSQPVPLGDVARAFRQQKLSAKKAEIVFEQDGSKDQKTR